MVALLLTAGFGTRMQPLTKETPKSLLPVAGRPILDYLIDELTSWDALQSIHLAVNHRDADTFREWAAGHRGTLANQDITVQVHDDGVDSPDEQLGVVGDLAFLLDDIGTPPNGALVSGGDSLYRFPLSPLLNQYRGTSNQALALYEPDVERRQHSSVLHLDGPQVTEITDDPTGGDRPWICPSWTLLSTEALQLVEPYLCDNRPDDSLGAFLNHVAHQQSLQAIRLPKQQALRLHCNTVDDLERARQLFQEEPQHLVGAERIRQCVKRNT